MLDSVLKGGVLDITAGLVRTWEGISIIPCLDGRFKAGFLDRESVGCTVTHGIQG